MKTIQILALCLLYVGITTAQTNRIRKADALYENLAFAQASREYRHIADKKQDAYSIRRLAECYVKLNEPSQAVIYYKQLIESGSFMPEDLLAYSKALRSNGEFDEAQVYLQQYCILMPMDLTAANYLQEAGNLVQDETAPLELHHIIGNGPLSDFAPYWMNNQLLFVSARATIGISKRTSAWDETPFLNIYTCQPDEGGFSNIQLLEGQINSRFHEGPVTIHPLLGCIYFTRNNYFNRHTGKSEDNTQKLKIYMAFQDEGIFSDIMDLSINSDEYSTGHPAISPDGKWLYFSSDMPGGMGGADLYKVELDENGTIQGNPVNLGSTINTAGNELFPFVHKDGLLFFSSNGWPGYGGLDIFVAETNAQGDYNRRTNVGKPANSEQDDFSIIVNEEQSEGYLSSNRPGGMGNDDIYHFDLLKPFGARYILKGFALNERSREPVPFATITLLKNDSVSEIIRSDENGYYEFSVDPDELYQLAARQDHFFDNQVSFRSVFESQATEIQQDITLLKDPGLSFYGIITDKASGEKLEGASITIVDKQSGEISEFKTGTSGDFRKLLAEKRLDDQLTFDIKMEKEGYLGRTVEFSELIVREGEIQFAGVLEKIEVGNDLAKIIDLKPIYFDYAKFNIRPDAALELDKIVQVLNDNPQMIVELGAHTDARGSAKANQSLSQKRAQSSAEYIRKRITHPERITAKGYGESVLLNKCADGVTCKEEDHQLNRRTEFRIISM